MAHHLAVQRFMSSSFLRLSPGLSPPLRRPLVVALVAVGFCACFVGLAGAQTGSGPGSATAPDGSGGDASNTQVPIRSWQLHEMDSSYVVRALDRAPGYGVNTAVFSHGMVYDVMDLYDGTPGEPSALRPSVRGRSLRAFAHHASSLNIRVWIWLHELADVPDRFVENGRVDLDRDALWNWLQQRYEQLFADYPQFDGLLLTFHETEYKIFDDDEVISSMSRPERFARLIRTIHRACANYDRNLVVRTFLYEPQELAWLEEGLREVPSEVMIQSKAVPHDWQPYYPHNPMIGAFPDRRQIVEFDASSEYTGKNRIPYTSPSYFLYRWRYALQYPEVVGYNARIDHGGYDVLYTPNAINLYALSRLTEDPTVTAGRIWTEWTTRRYGLQAGRHVEHALAPSFEVVNRSFFPLEFWITDHSRLPSFEYADSHISGRSPAKWYPESERYARLERRLNRPDPGLLERILAEKDTAVALADQSLLHLRRSRPFLTDGEYEDLEWRLRLLRRTAEIWGLHAEAFFGYEVLAEGYRVPGLVRRVERAVAGLRRQAEVARLDPRTDGAPPGDPENVEAVAAELERKLGELVRRRSELGEDAWTRQPWPRHTIDASSRGADGTRRGDLNGDGLSDVVTGWEEGGVVRAYLHPGYERVRRGWKRITVGRNPDVEDAVATDLDGDGRPDVVSAAEGETRRIQVHWAPPRHARLEDESAWSSATVPATRDRMRWMFTTPIRVGASRALAAGAKNEGAQIGLLRLPDDPRRLADWSWHPLSRAGWIMSLRAADMDGDGDEDLLLSDRYGPMRGVRWLEQPDTASESDRWTNHYVGGRDREIMFLDRGDVTGNGRADIVAATHSDTLLFFRQDESGAYERSAIRLPKRTGTGKAVAIGDVDGDGSTDLVFSCEDAEGLRGLMWLSHEEGDPWTEWNAHELGGVAGTKFDLVRLLDLDGDGDLDVLTSEEQEQLGVVWYENPLRNPVY